MKLTVFSNQSLSLLISILERLQRLPKAKFVTKLTNANVACIFQTPLVFVPVLFHPITKQPKTPPYKTQNLITQGQRENGDKLV